MNVKELKAMLTLLPDEMDIFMLCDAEVNSSLPLYEADPNVVVCDGEIYPDDFLASDAGLEEGEWADLLRGPRVLALWPM